MDIWTWVGDLENDLRERDKESLANAIEQIPSLVCGDNHEKLDQIYPEALNLAKKESNPWIEVFVRHWYLQSQVLHRYNVKGMLSEAIDLLEFSSRESTKDCPQSICVVQDLANCYAKQDGPAYVAERIAVSTETLARITPAWPCYDCIATEEIAALVDLEDYDSALEKIYFYREEMAKASYNGEKNPFALLESRIMREMGHYEKAERIARESDNPYGGESFAKYRISAIALALAYQKKFDEAGEFTLKFSDAILAHSHYLNWCELYFLMAKNTPEQNNDELNYCFNKMIENFICNGVLRDTIKLLSWQSELAILRNDVFTLEQSVKRLKELVGQLSKDLGASELLQALINKLGEIKVKLLAETVIDQEFLDELYDRDIKHSLSTLKIAYEQKGNLTQVAQAYFDSLVENGYISQGCEVAEKHFQIDLNCHSLIGRYGYLLLNEKLEADFDSTFNSEFINNLSKGGQNTALWLLALRHQDTSPSKSLAFLQKSLELEPNDPDTLERAAQIALQLDEYSLSISYWTQLIDLDPSKYVQFHWDKMIPGTLLEDWALVRESCSLLGVELKTKEGRVEQDMGVCRIQFVDLTGEKLTLFANRVGPVEAEITSIRRFGNEQYFGDRIVIEATPLNSLDIEDEEGYRCDSEGYYTYIYPKAKTLRKNPHFYFSIDGVYPGDDNWQQLEKLLESLNLKWSVRSTDEYQVQKDKTAPKLDAIYLYVACPMNTDLVQLNKELYSLVDSFEHPMIWPELLIELKDEEGLKIQEKVEQQYQLS